MGRALALADGMRDTAAMLEERIGREVESTLARRRLALDALSRFRSGPLPITGDLVERARAAYREGAFDLVELLDAYRAAWDARAEALALEQEVAAAEATLLRVTATP